MNCRARACGGALRRVGAPRNDWQEYECARCGVAYADPLDRRVEPEVRVERERMARISELVPRAWRRDLDD